ncbi:hypothetical protein ACFFWD_20970 [Bradyrhizobium erythrophlei]|uniref:hypothetical protein n=1 Tax=Bradyrhizobium erythrophlei TaxID=1437360 RepID=UPI0035E6FDFE
MTRLQALGAAALLAAAMASPAMAQQTTGKSVRCSGINCETMGPANATTGTATQRRGAYRSSYNRYEGGPLWPVAAAAGVAAGAVGTAAAIATAPIGGAEYARQNGFVCTPGTWFRGDDGRRHPCQ